jgi:hypothetical protein
MAISIVKTPQLIQPIYNPIYLTVNSTNTNELAHNFIFDLYVNGNFVNRDNLIKIPNTRTAEYNPARMLESYVSYDKSASYTGVSASTNCIVQYEIRLGEEYIDVWNFNDNANAKSVNPSYSAGTLFTSFTDTHTFNIGDSIYIQQNAGYSYGGYNGVFNIIQVPNNKSIIISNPHISTPVNGGMVRYADSHKSVFFGTNILANPNMIYSLSGYTSYGPDGCNVRAGLNTSNRLSLVVPDASCGTGLQTITNTATTFSAGTTYTITTIVDIVNNPSNEAQTVRVKLGTTFGNYHVGTGTFIDTLTYTGGTFGVEMNLLDADTGGFGSHSISIRSINVEPIVIFSAFAYNSVFQYEQIPSYNYLDYIPTSGSSTDPLFLTHAPKEQKIKENERASIGFFNAGFIDPLGYSNVTAIILTTYQLSGGTTQFAYPYSISGFLNNNTNDLINEFGIGPWNLNNAANGYILNFPSGIPYSGLVIDSSRDYKYDIQLYNGVGNLCSEIKTYVLDTECTKYPDVRFMFLNQLGQFDYFTSTLVNRRTVNTSKTTYQRTLASNYQVGDRGTSIIAVEAQEVFVANCNWIDEETYYWLMELYYSTEVYILNEDGSLIPIIIDNASIPIKTRVNDQLFNLTINYTKANKINTQRG